MEQGIQEGEYREHRLANLQKLQAAGYAPFGAAFARTGRLAEVAAGFVENQPARIAGRVIARREMGKSIFAHLQDGSGRFQIYLKQDAIGPAAFAAFAHVDLGDQIGAEGTLFTTRTGEKTLKVEHWTMLSKALLPPPAKWHGLHDTEVRYRCRYLDLVANPEVRELFNTRIAAVRAIRQFLCDRGFYEVETPMLQPMAGGAAANPFKTFYQALGQDMYLRIAPELYLKRLLVGDFDKVFELNRNFRNEGLDRSHNPEFTMLEIYEAFGDVRSMMTLVQELITTVARQVCGTLQVGDGDLAVDLTPPWPEVRYRDLVEQKMGAGWFALPLEEARARARAQGLDIPAEWQFLEITQEVYEKLIERHIRNPTFVTRLPVELVPLARRCADDPTVVDVFELVIRGREIAPGYTELNDPLDQRARLMEQAGGDPSKIDEDFLLALEHGMPPAGGMGVGIDRLIMVLTGAESIRDVVLFPQLKNK